VAEARAPFVPAGWPEGVVLSFWLADFVVLVGGSIAAAAAGARGRSWARAALTCVAGGALYATLWCIATGAMGLGWLSAGLMLPCSGGTLACCIAVLHGR